MKGGFVVDGPLLVLGRVLLLLLLLPVAVWFVLDVSPVLTYSGSIITARHLPQAQACSNYAKGKWVADARRPLYSGNECRRWLSRMWSCRRTERTDFSYESYRWQPHDCEMPDFSGPNFLQRYVLQSSAPFSNRFCREDSSIVSCNISMAMPIVSCNISMAMPDDRMRNRTLAFVGDSLGREQFQSMMCIATGGKRSPEVEDVGRRYGLEKAPSPFSPGGSAYRFPETNTTILFYWSATLSQLEPLTDERRSYALHLDRPAPFLKEHLPSFDALVLNTGHH
ncbi:hypothetical protein VPH35_105942 [Triticum aestivum]